MHSPSRATASSSAAQHDGNTATASSSYSHPPPTLGDKTTSDFVIVAEQREIPVHRTILTRTSPFLNAFLTADPSCTRINANNAKYEAMLIVLSVMYTANTPSAAVSGGVAAFANSKYDFSVILSAWEIAMHFQLSEIANTAAGLLVPLLSRYTVVRALRSCLKHPRDAGAMRIKDASSAYLPPLDDTDEQRAEYRTLVDKYPIVGEMAARAEEGRRAEAAAAATEKQQQEERDASLGERGKSLEREKALLAKERELERREAAAAQLLLQQQQQMAMMGSSNTNGSVMVTPHAHLITTAYGGSANVSTATAGTLHYGGGVMGATAPSPITATNGYNHNIATPMDSPIRGADATRQALFQQQPQQEMPTIIDSLSAAELQANADEIANLEATLRQLQSTATTQHSDQRAELQSLTTMLTNLDDRDADIVDALSNLRAMEAEEAAMLKAAEALAEEHTTLEATIAENEEYVRNAQIYVPAAHDAVQVLTGHLDAIIRATSSGTSGGGRKANATAAKDHLKQLLGELKKDKVSTTAELQEAQKVSSGLKHHIQSEQNKTDGINEQLMEMRSAAAAAAASSH